MSTTTQNRVIAENNCDDIETTASDLRETFSTIINDGEPIADKEKQIFSDIDEIISFAKCSALHIEELEEEKGKLEEKVKELEDELDEVEEIESTDISDLSDHEFTCDLGDSITAQTLPEANALEAFARLCYKYKSAQKVADLLSAIAA